MGRRLLILSFCYGMQGTEMLHSSSKVSYDR
jgi:hypothetical protein